MGITVYLRINLDRSTQHFAAGKQVDYGNVTYRRSRDGKIQRLILKVIPIGRQFGLKRITALFITENNFRLAPRQGNCFFKSNAASGQVGILQLERSSYRNRFGKSNIYVNKSRLSAFAFVSREIRPGKYPDGLASFLQEAAISSSSAISPKYGPDHRVVAFDDPSPTTLA